jgi:hypothetical protein
MTSAGNVTPGPGEAMRFLEGPQARRSPVAPR